MKAFSVLKTQLFSKKIFQRDDDEMREMVLTLDLEDMIEAFKTVCWKFFEEDEEHNIIKVEVPRGTGEAYVVELPYVDDKERIA